MVCLQCGSTENLSTISETNTQYDGLEICEKCSEYNESQLDWDDFN